MTTQPRSWLKIVHKLTNLLSCPDFIAQHRTHPKHFTRKRHLTFRNLILFLLNQPKSALQTELDAFFQTLNGSAFETQVVTAQAFSKARQKLSASVFEALNSALHAQMNELGLHKTWQGLRLLAVDGSSMHLPLEDPLARHFGTHNGLPVARVSVLQDLLSDQTLHALLITPDVDERGCASMHLKHAPDHSLILFDWGLSRPLALCRATALSTAIPDAPDTDPFPRSPRVCGFWKRRRHRLHDVPIPVIPTGL